MQIKMTRVMVNDQKNTLRFYKAILSFVKKSDMPMSQFRWLTVISPEGAEDVELLLEPMGFPPDQTYQNALFDAGIPMTAFLTNDIRGEHRWLKELGVRFRGDPESTGVITSALFKDAWGNLINLVQPAA
jgi:predicted enzyme related to lactoylglutathione lyase